MSTRSLILPLEIPKKRKKKKYTFAMEDKFPFQLCVNSTCETFDKVFKNVKPEFEISRQSSLRNNPVL